jgi:hypothetical protein
MKYVSLKLVTLLMALAGVGLLCGERQTAASGQAAAAEKLFLETIQPLLATKCQGCHNDDSASAALNLQTRAGLLKGGRRGASIVAGKIVGQIVHFVRIGADIVKLFGGARLLKDARLMRRQLAFFVQATKRIHRRTASGIGDDENDVRTC